MAVQDPPPGNHESLDADSQPPVRPERPSWADEATVAVPLTELFPDDGAE